MYSQEEILKALETIKNTCKHQDECEYCPLSKNTTCVLQDQPPQDWKIREQDPPMIWRAFK